VLFICYFLTVFFDMVVAVSAGVVLAAFLFMRRMADLTESRLTLESIAEEGTERVLPPGVMLYEINGPLFFGAAQSAMSALQAIRGHQFEVLILDLGRVPVIDATGLAALENSISNVLRQKKRIILAGPLPKPHSVFDKSHLETKYKGLSIAPSLELALGAASEMVSSSAPVAPVASGAARAS
jgi:sulfate permease, SulP family